MGSSEPTLVSRWTLKKELEKLIMSYKATEIAKCFLDVVDILIEIWFGGINNPEMIEQVKTVLEIKKQVIERAIARLSSSS